ARARIVTSSEGGVGAEQERQRQEREAVRGAEGQGHVEGARRAHRQLARRVEPRRQGVALVELAQQLVAGWDNRAEEGRRPQGREGHRAQVVSQHDTLATRKPRAHARGLSFALRIFRKVLQVENAENVRKGLQWREASASL